MPTLNVHIPCSPHPWRHFRRKYLCSPSTIIDHLRYNPLGTDSCFCANCVADTKTQSKDGEIPHLLFYGPAGSGKKTRVLALLKRIYGPGAERVRLEYRSFKTPSNRVVELTTVASNYHIEMSPGDAGIYDRYVVQVRCEIQKCMCGHVLLFIPCRQDGR